MQTAAKRRRFLETIELCQGSKFLLFQAAKKIQRMKALYYYLNITNFGVIEENPHAHRGSLAYPSPTVNLRPSQMLQRKRWD